MAFNSLTFIYFLLLVLAAYNLAPPRARTWVLLFAGYAFYASFSQLHVLLLLWITACAVVGGSFVRRHGYLLPPFIVTCLVPLLVYKGAALPVSVSATTTESVGWIAPIGLAFFTLQAIGYLVDVARDDARPDREPHRVALFLSFFPHLLAGPIARAAQLLPQLAHLKRTSTTDIYVGLKVLAWGVFCKYVVADNLAPIVNQVFTEPHLESGGSLALATLTFSFQLYFDFLGYSSIAIGLARLFGISLAMNFDRPYAAESLKDFWHRWHISLSSWFRDYVYRPLGGRFTTGWWRGTTVMIVFLMSGIWHGAAVNFIAWGGFHGLAYLVEERVERRRRWHVRELPQPVRIVLTFLIVTIGWIFFRVSEVRDLQIVFARLALFDREVAYGSINAVFFQMSSVVALAFALSAIAIDNWKDISRVLYEEPRSRSHMVSELAVVNWIVIAFILFGDQGSNAFVYFAF